MDVGTAPTAPTASTVLIALAAPAALIVYAALDAYAVGAAPTPQTALIAPTALAAPTVTVALTPQTTPTAKILICIWLDTITPPTNQKDTKMNISDREEKLAEHCYKLMNNEHKKAYLDSFYPSDDSFFRYAIKSICNSENFLRKSEDLVNYENVMVCLYDLISQEML